MLGVTLYIEHGKPTLALLGMGLAAWLFVGALVEFAERIRLFRTPLQDTLRRLRQLPRAAWGMTIAHAGVAVMVAGITASSAWQTERVEFLRIGEALNVAGYDIKLTAVDRASGPNYTARRGTFEVTRHGKPVVTMHPEKRIYPVTGMPTTEAAIHTTGFADLYVVLGDPDLPVPPGGQVNFPGRRAAGHALDRAHLS